MKQKLLLFLFSLSIVVACDSKPELNKQNYPGHLESGSIDSYVDFPSNFVRSRNVDVWLPDGYSSDQTYQVLYMHDGQMLYDANLTWNKQEWGVDETLGSLIATGKVPPTIVVSIWNHADIRWNDYFPIKAGQAGLDAIPMDDQDTQDTYVNAAHNADEYLKFIVKELKPYIDEHYSVYTDAEHTFVGGSSMGGLISMYAICEYPQVFSGAICMSTHWTGIKNLAYDNPIPDSFMSYFKSNFPKDDNHKIYFDYGTETLDATYAPYEPQLDFILGEMNLDSRAENIKFDGHAHDEISWNKRLSIPFEFILNN